MISLVSFRRLAKLFYGFGNSSDKIWNGLASEEYDNDDGDYYYFIYSYIRHYWFHPPSFLSLPELLFCLLIFHHF